MSSSKVFFVKAFRMRWGLGGRNTFARFAVDASLRRISSEFTDFEDYGAYSG